MDKDNVIIPTYDMEVLRDDFESNYQSLTYKQRLEADKKAKEKYGMDNPNIYRTLVTNFHLASRSEDEIQRDNDSDTKPMPGETRTDTFYRVLKARLKQDDDVESRADDINLVRDKEEKDGVVVISKGLYDDTPLYSEESLETKYLQYRALSDEDKAKSDMLSNKIWGCNVETMYLQTKGQLQSITESSAYNMNNLLKPDPLHSFVKDVLMENRVDDPIRTEIRVLDCLTSGRTLSESTILDNLSDTLGNQNSFVDYSEDIPMITPWFNPDEMSELFNIEVDPYEYILKGNKVTGLYEEIKKAMNKYNQAYVYEYELGKKNLESCRETVIKLGWNPSVEYTPEALSHARSRQIEWMNSNKQIKIVNVDRYSLSEDVEEPAIAELEPVYITLIRHGGINSKVIRLGTHSSWSHAGITFDNSLKEIYSFNASTPNKRSGFSIENVKFYEEAKDVYLKVITFFVEPKIKKALKEKVDFYMKNMDKTTYSFANIFNIILNKTKDTAYSLSMVCSQFVDNVLKMVNIDLTGKPSNLVNPGDFDRKTRSSDSKLYIVYEGPLKSYKPRTVKDKINKLLSSLGSPDSLIVRPVAEALEGVFTKSPNISSFYVETGDTTVDKSLGKIRDLLLPEAVIVEAKPLPIRFSKSGNLFIDKPIDLEQEYQEAHRLLMSYNENNIEGIKHQLARLFYINSIIEKKIRKMKKGDEEYKTLIDLRARVINDFTTYMEVVQKVDSNFDFESYLKNSEYYNKTVMVDKHTMRYSGKIIKDMLKLMK